MVRWWSVGRTTSSSSWLVGHPRHLWCQGVRSARLYTKMARGRVMGLRAAPLMMRLVALSVIPLHTSAFTPVPLAARPAARLPGLLVHRRPIILLAAAAAAGPPENEQMAAAAASAEAEPLASVISVLIAAFLNLLGFTMMLGFTPALAAHFGLEVGARFGSLTSAYPIGMLAGVRVALYSWPRWWCHATHRPTAARLPTHAANPRAGLYLACAVGPGRACARPCAQPRWEWPRSGRTKYGAPQRLVAEHIPWAAHADRHVRGR
jgi:hypothetical protein